MRETMYELLSYEPYESISGPEKRYILSVLDITGEIKPPKDIKYQKLFETFYSNRDKADLSWLSTWIKTYKTKRTYPKLLKKICYYYMLNHGHNNESILVALGLKKDGTNIKGYKDNGDKIEYSRKLLNKWNLYADYRKESEEHKHISLPIHRRGLKQEYLTKFIQMVYYEAHRQDVNGKIQHLDFYTQNKEKRAKKKDLPVFVDVFGGTSSVAASMNVESKHKVVNEFDKIALGTLFILVNFPEEFINVFEKFNVDILKGEYEKKVRQIFTKDIEIEDSKKGTKGIRVPNGRAGLWYYTDTNILFKIEEKDRNGWSNDTLELVKRIRNAWFYSQAMLFDLKQNHHAVDYIELNKHRSLVQYDYTKDYLDYGQLLKKGGVTKYKQYFDKMLLGACYFMYYHSFEAMNDSGEPDFRGINVSEYRDFLLHYFDLKMQIDLDVNCGLNSKVCLINKGNNDLSKYLLNVNYLLRKEVFLQEWRESLKNAVLGTLSFEELFVDSNAFYYLDSPYWLTSQYDNSFTDEMHMEMLDILRKGDFKWLFSMQYINPDFCRSSKDENKRIKEFDKEVKMIKNYFEYYKGFLAGFRPSDDDQRIYVADYEWTNLDSYPDINVIFGNENTLEIFVTNVDVRRLTPYGDYFVQLPLKRLIEYIDACYCALDSNTTNNLYVNYKNNHPNRVKFNFSYLDIKEFAKVEYEMALTP